MPRSDREVFDHLTSDSTTEPHIDLLTYAQFAAEKKEWMLLFEKSNDRPPSQAEIDAWIAGVTDYQFNRMRSAALDMFSESAESYLAQRIADEKEKLLTSTLVSQVKAATSFWKQFGLAVLTAILAPLILGLVLVAINAYGHLFTHNDVAKRLPAPSPQAPTTPQP
jgi:hypothetical protein